MSREVTIERRFRGPTTSGNGGYTCGRVAAGLAGAVEVTLRAPPPLERAMRLDGVDPRHLFDGDLLVAQAQRVGDALDVGTTDPAQPLPPAPSFEDATRASERYIGHHGHPFPECFVCGPDREPHDGLCIFAGRLHPTDPLARAPWVPDESLDRGDGTVDPAFLWAALDCPGYFGFAKSPVRCVLGRMTAQVEEGLRIGTRCVAVGWSLGEQGRKRFAASAVFDAQGRAWGRSRQVWIAVDA